MDAVAGQDLYSAAVINFVDQSLGKIEQRIWSFGDALNTTVPIDDPNVHTINYTYQSAGTFKPSLLVIYEDAIYRKIYSQEITIL
jgi:PKD repeat protein